MSLMQKDVHRVARQVDPSLSDEDWAWMLGDFLHYLCIREGMSLHALAEMIGAAPYDLGQQFKGTNCLGMECLDAAARHFTYDNVRALLEACHAHIPQDEEECLALTEALLHAAKDGDC